MANVSGKRRGPERGESRRNLPRHEAAPNPAKPEQKTCKAKAGEDEPFDIERPERLFLHLLNKERGENHPGNADRHIDPKDPAPVEIGGDEAAKERAGNRPTGTIIAPPSPWRVRAPTSSGKVFDIPQRIDPAMKTPMAMRKIVRVPKRSAAQPLAGIKIASETR